MKADDEPCKLYRFRSLGDRRQFARLRDTLKKHRLYCPRPEELNDPFDCVVKMGDGDARRAEDIQARVSMRAGILSFTEHNSNILMWSHYAGSHRGMCLQFDMRVWNPNNRNRPCHLDKVAYCMNRPLVTEPNSNQTDTAALKAMAFTKHADWRYEDEWRMICSFKSCRPRFLKFPKSALTGIIFGLRMADNDRRAVKKIIRDAEYPNLTLYEAREDHNRFRHC